MEIVLTSAIRSYNVNCHVWNIHRRHLVCVHKLRTRGKWVLDYHISYPTRLCLALVPWFWSQGGGFQSGTLSRSLCPSQQRENFALQGKFDDTTFSQNATVPQAGTVAARFFWGGGVLGERYLALDVSTKWLVWLWHQTKWRRYLAVCTQRGRSRVVGVRGEKGLT
jgi:hypothetical protein